MQLPKKTIRFIVYGGSIALILGAIWYFTRPAPPEVELAAVTYGNVEATVVNTRAGTVKA